MDKRYTKPLHPLIRQDAFTLIEILIVTAMIAVIIGVSSYVYITVLRTSQFMQTRYDLEFEIINAMSKIQKDLTQAAVIDSAGAGSIQFQVDIDTTTVPLEVCRYYLYSASEIPPPYNQSSYMLYKGTATAGNVAYGTGVPLVRDLLPPPTSQFTQTGNMITIELSAKRNDEAIYMRTDIRPRNLP